MSKNGREILSKKLDTFRQTGVSKNGEIRQNGKKSQKFV